MQTLTFINNQGESIEFGRKKPFILSHLDGMGGAVPEIQKTRSPFQDGSSVSRVRMTDRDVVLTGAIMAESQEQLYELRRQLTRVINPKLSGRFVYKNDYRSYSAEAIPDDGPTWGERHGSNQLFTVSFTCPLPFLLDEYEQSQLIATWIGGIRFQLSLPTTFALRGPKRVNIINSGDVETPVRIEFKGPAINPKVANLTTGEYIQVNRTLLNSDKLIITTEFGNKRVEIEDSGGGRTNVLHWITLDSSFWQLAVGDNIIEYSTENEGDVEPDAVTIYYRNRFNGA